VEFYDNKIKKKDQEGSIWYFR